MICCDHLLRFLHRSRRPLLPNSIRFTHQFDVHLRSITGAAADKGVQHKVGVAEVGSNRLCDLQAGTRINACLATLNKMMGDYSRMVSSSDANYIDITIGIDRTVCT